MGSVAGVIGVQGILPVPFGVACPRCRLRVIGFFPVRRVGVAFAIAAIVAIVAIVVALVLSRSCNEDYVMPYAWLGVLRLSPVISFDISCHFSL